MYNLYNSEQALSSPVLCNPSKYQIIQDENVFKAEEFREFHYSSEAIRTSMEDNRILQNMFFSTCLNIFTVVQKNNICNTGFQLPALKACFMSCLNIFRLL